MIVLFLVFWRWFYVGLVNVKFFDQMRRESVIILKCLYYVVFIDENQKMKDLNNYFKKNFDYKDDVGIVCMLSVIMVGIWFFLDMFLFRFMEVDVGVNIQ